MNEISASENRNAPSITDTTISDDTIMLIHEILKMDRLLYLTIIRNRGSLTSLQMTREILALRNNLKSEQIKDRTVLRSNPNINKRLKDLVDLGILNDLEGKYSLNSIGSTIIDDLKRLNSNIEILRKYKGFFDTHDYTAIPPQQFREIHSLQFAKQCEDVIDYYRQIEENTAKTNYRILMVTERIHDIPIWIIEESKQRNLNLKLVYQFKTPFVLNSDDEEELELLENLINDESPTIEIRYMTLEGVNPIGIRIIDRKWTILNLFNLAENKPNRPKSFYGTNERFVTWVENIFLNIWERSKLLEPGKVCIKIYD
jgi:predicted transcriptional regulator